VHSAKAAHLKRRTYRIPSEQGKYQGNARIYGHFGAAPGQFTQGLQHLAHKFPVETEQRILFAEQGIFRRNRETQEIHSFERFRTRLSIGFRVRAMRPAGRACALAREGTSGITPAFDRPAISSGETSTLPC